jgi:hypothetical protein
MDSNQDSILPRESPPDMSSFFSDNKNVLIIILSMLLLLSVLGVTFINVIMDWIKHMLNVLATFFGGVFGNIFYSTGDILNATSSSVAQVAKTSIDLGNGAVNDVGNLLKAGVTGDVVPRVPVGPIVLPTTQASVPSSVPPQTSAPSVTVVPTRPVTLDQMIQDAMYPPTHAPVEPSPTPSENPIQQSIQSTNKASWCLIGQSGGKRSCVQIDPTKSQCGSGKIFPSGELCVNP